MGKRRRKKKGVLSRAQEGLEWAALRSAVAAFNLVGERGAAALAGAAAKAAFGLRVRLPVVRHSLRTAFGGEMSADGLEDLARGSYRQWCVTFAEWARIWRRDLDDVLDRVEMKGDGPVLDTLRQGRGVIAVTAHFGHFELMPLCWARRHGPINLVVRPLDNPWLDAALDRLRSRYGCRVLARRGVVREAIRRLRAGEMLGVLIDQNMIGREGVFVEFFGEPACTTSLPALLALRTGAAVFAGFIFRQAPFRHLLVFGPEIPLIETGDLRADVEANTAQYTQAVEDVIRARPDHWLWAHSRWRTRPAPGQARPKALGRSGAGRP